jgi:Flp pilus assembly protein TadG
MESMARLVQSNQQKSMTNNSSFHFIDQIPISQPTSLGSTIQSFKLVLTKRWCKIPKSNSHNKKKNKKETKMKGFLKNQKGAGIAIFAFASSVIIGMAAFAVDVGVLMTAKNQLQSGIDASVLAAASGLQVGQFEAINRGIQISQQDTLIDEALDLEQSDFTFIDRNKVNVTTTKTINLFFSQLFGIANVPITASATAVLGNRDIMLIFDRSGSMDDDTPRRKKNRPIPPPQPITDTMEAADFFVDRIYDNTISIDELGLVSYSTDARLDEPVGRNFNDIRRKILDFKANGYTNIGGAIHVANTELLGRARSHTQKILILLSDGMANRPGWGSPTNRTAIRYAKEKADFASANRIKIYTISLGHNTDKNLMDYIADKTGGHHYNSPTTAELRSIFDEIAKRIPAMLIS